MKLTALTCMFFAGYAWATRPPIVVGSLNGEMPGQIVHTFLAAEDQQDGIPQPKIYADNHEAKTMTKAEIIAERNKKSDFMNCIGSGRDDCNIN
jgi:hypothetical protein